MSRGITGMTAIVTGAGSAGAGIGNGRASAIRLAEEGARVALLDVTDSNLETKEIIEGRGGECEAFRCDVSDPEAAEEVIFRIHEQWDRIDILVNNVGVAGPPGTVVDVDLNAWNRCLAVNLTSMVVMSRFVIPHMARAGGGSIINMTALAGLRGGHAAIAYATTKGAIVNLTQAMASHHGHQAIRVNAVAPGPVFTPMVAVHGIHQAMREVRASSTLLGSEGTGWDVAEAVLYLATPAARWVTGVVLPVDGGLASFSSATQVSITEAGVTATSAASGGQAG